jgi:recombination protein RecA
MSDEKVLDRAGLEILRAELSKDKSVGGMLFWGSDERLVIEWLPTGIAPFDAAMGGGFAFGRITELIGAFSSGKTLLAYMAVVQAQARGLTACFVDVEKSYDPEWAKTLGVNTDDLLVARPRSGEQAWDMVEQMCLAGVGVVVMDSIAQLVPTAEAEGGMDDLQVGAQARLVNKGLRKVTLANEKTIVILINQLRSAVGVRYGNPEVLPGGKGQGFVASQLVRVRRGDWIEEGTGDHKRRIGYILMIRVEKSKLGEPWREGSVPFFFTGQMDEAAAMAPLAVELGIVTKRGATYTLPNGDRIIGMAKLREAISADEGLQAELRQKIAEVPEF